VKIFTPTVSLREHFEALREADQRALQIKEKDAAEALSLARENQRLKEEQHNNVLNQWRDERGEYATKTELANAVNRFETAHQPVVEFMAANLGCSKGTLDVRTIIFAVLGLTFSAAALILTFIGAAVAVLALILK
jgi:hypothetical protein